MANYIDADKLKAEIERKRDKNREGENLYYDVNDIKNAGICRHRRYLCEELLSFLSTLEESGRPEPYNPVYDEAYLNEKIKKATESWKGVDVDAMLAECRGYDEEKSEKPMNQDEELNNEIKAFVNEYGYEKSEDILLIAIVARHFAQWGAEHLKK